MDLFGPPNSVSPVDPIENMLEIFSPMLMVAAIVMVLLGGIALLRSAFDSYSGGSVAPAIIFIALSGVLFGAGGLIKNIANDTASVTADPSPSASPSASVTETPSPTPTVSATPAPPSEPVDYTLWWLIPLIVVCVLVAIGLLYLMTRTVRRDLSSRKQQRETRELLDSRWSEYTSRHDRIKRKALDAETDWHMVFSYPALQDTSVPQTAAFYTALRHADERRGPRPQDLKASDNMSGLPYPRAVITVEDAWATALRHAERTGLHLIPAAERKTIKRIRDLLKLAENAGGTANEREMAYARAQKLMQSLQSVTVPAKLYGALEDQHRAALTTGQSLSWESQ